MRIKMNNTGCLLVAIVMLLVFSSFTILFRALVGFLFSTPIGWALLILATAYYFYHKKKKIKADVGKTNFEQPSFDDEDVPIVDVDFEEFE